MKGVKKGANTLRWRSSLVNLRLVVKGAATFTGLSWRGATLSLLCNAERMRSLSEPTLFTSSTLMRVSALP